MVFKIQYTIDRVGPWIDWDSFSSFELAQQQRERFVKVNKGYVGKGFSTRILKIVETIVWDEGSSRDWVPAEVAQKLYDMLKRARHAAENDYACGEDLLEDIDEALVHAEGGEDAIR